MRFAGCGSTPLGSMTLCAPNLLPSFILSPFPEAVPARDDPKIHLARGAPWILLSWAVCQPSILMTEPAPWPPPTQAPVRPIVLPRFWSSWMSVTTMRVPVLPSG